MTYAINGIREGGVSMLAAVKGVLKGNTVVIEDEDLKEYDGAEVVVTVLEYPASKKKEKIDWDSFVMPTKRGNDVEGYMKEMRDNDRI